MPEAENHCTHVPKPGKSGSRSSDLAGSGDTGEEPLSPPVGSGWNPQGEGGGSRPGAREQQSGHQAAQRGAALLCLALPGPGRGAKSLQVLLPRGPERKGHRWVLGLCCISDLCPPLCSHPPST